MLDTAIGDPGVNLSKVGYRGCVFTRIEINSDADVNHLPHFSACYVHIIEGRLSVRDLPEGIFDKCEITQFQESYSTNDSILNLTRLPVGLRVMLTILRKLYVQPGSGRKESALFRGLDQHAKLLVPAALELLRREKLAIRSGAGFDIVWLPVRSDGVRVRRILSSPTTEKDPILLEAATIG